MGDITGANAIFYLTVDELYDTPQLLQGFASDDAFTTQELQVSNPVMGLDGQLLGGVSLVPIEQTIVLQADSPSNALFDNWSQANVANISAYTATGTIIIPNLGRQWTLYYGLLMRIQPILTAKKLIQPRRHTIAWGSIVPSNTA